MESKTSGTALAAGFFAALASVFGKLAMDGGPAESFCCHYWLDCTGDRDWSFKVCAEYCFLRASRITVVFA